MSGAAVAINLSPRRVASYVAEGLLPSVKLGRRRVILIDDLRAFLAARRHPRAVEDDAQRL